MKAKRISPRIILLIVFCIGILCSSLYSQSPVLLYQQVNLKKNNAQLKGYLDLELPDISHPSIRLIQTYYSLTPNEHLIEEGVFKARWNANKLIGIESMKILMILELGGENLKEESNLNFIQAYFPSMRWDILVDWKKCPVNRKGNIVYKPLNRHNKKTKILLYKIGNENLVQEKFDNHIKDKVKETIYHTTSDIERISRVASNIYHIPTHQNSDYLLRELIKIQPKNPKYYNFLGVSLARKGEFELSFKTLRKAYLLSLSPIDKVLADYALANFYALKNQKNKAIHHLKRIMSSRDGVSRIINIKDDVDFHNLMNYPPLIHLIQEARRTTPTTRD